MRTHFVFILPRLSGRHPFFVGIFPEISRYRGLVDPCGMRGRVADHSLPSPTVTAKAYPFQRLPVLAFSTLVTSLNAKNNMNTGKPLVNKKYILEKFPGKGGWTYAPIPEIQQDKEAPFGWVRVRGSIDGFEIKNCLLMPMGSGKLFLPVKAEIRKKIKKAAGNEVTIILYKDDLAIEIPEELQACLEDEPEALEKFQRYSNEEQEAFINWIYSAKKTETKIQRIATTIDKVMRSQKLTEKKLVDP